MSVVGSVSVAIPVHNGAHHLGDAIQSVLEQALQPVELKVYDNASSDRSVEIACQFLDREFVVGSARNLGAAANFNRAARGSDPSVRFFAWLAADDRFDSRFLARAVDVLSTNPEAPACLTGVRFIDPAGRPLATQTDEALGSHKPAVRLRSFLRRPRWTEFYCLYRRERLLASPLMSEEYGADVLLTWWFLLRSPLAVTPEPLLEYRIYPTKSVDEMATALNPDATRQHWRKLRMWRRLRSMTFDVGVDTSVGRRARRELVLALFHQAWMVHVLEDVFERWPVTRRLARRLRHPGTRGRPH